MTSGRRLDLAGHVFYRLSVQVESESRTAKNGTKAIFWRCICECGNEVWVRGAALNNGKSKSCGCLCRDMTSKAKKTHGMCASPEYQSWRGMWERTTNPNNSHFHIYGAIGVSVCERWKSFEMFLEDMGKRPDGTTLDRFPDMAGDYPPDNCRWATPSEQSRNTSRTKFVSWDGITLCMKDWAVHLGITGGALDWRIKNWGLERAMTTPPSSFHQSLRSK